jgi:hypothetical protein
MITRVNQDNENKRQIWINKGSDRHIRDLREFVTRPEHATIFSVDEHHAIKRDRFILLSEIAYSSLTQRPQEEQVGSQRKVLQLEVG